jgi:DNA-binding GntR family transcriptional regulator
MLKFLIPNDRTPLRKTDYVLESLRNAIILRHLPPGTRITEQQVKDALNVSSSPIREAFNQLEAEGLLTRSPHVGTKVTEIDVSDAKELYSIHLLLQSASVQISAKKLKDEDIDEAERINLEIEHKAGGEIDVEEMRMLNYKFHLLVCGINVYPWLTKLLSSLWIRLPMNSVWSVPSEPNAAIQFHKKIIEAIRERNGDLAGEVMKRHLERSMEVLFKEPKSHSQG